MMGANDDLVAGFLQTDAAINRGNSGGPLFNLNGEVVGINAAIRADGQNIGFAVPITPVKNILTELRTGKPLSRGWLGVRTRDMDQEYQEGLGVDEGVLVESVAKPSPADKAGVKRMDVIVGVDGKPIKNGSELVDAIASRREGDVAKLEIVRNGRRQTIPVTLGDRRNMDREDEYDGGASSPDTGKKDSSDGMNLEKNYGFRVGPLNAQNRRAYQIPDDVSGVVVTKVLPRSSASDKRLSAGMVVSGVGAREVASMDEFRSEAQKYSGKTIILSIRQRGGRQDDFSEPFSVAVPAAPAGAPPKK
jgi:serine protease Do